jgi:hypothetical protein
LSGALNGLAAESLAICRTTDALKGSASACADRNRSRDARDISGKAAEAPRKCRRFKRSSGGYRGDDTQRSTPLRVPREERRCAKVTRHGGSEVSKLTEGDPPERHRMRGGHPMKIRLRFAVLIAVACFAPRAEAG